MSPISCKSLNGANSGFRGPREEAKKRKIIRIRTSCLRMGVRRQKTLYGNVAGGKKFTTRNKRLVVKFHSDTGLNRKGFKASWKELSKKSQPWARLGWIVKATHLIVLMTP